VNLEISTYEKKKTNVLKKTLRNFLKPPQSRGFPWHFLLAKKPVAIIHETKGCSQPRDGWKVGLYGIKKTF
jgi:hypothetical protein